MQVTRLRRYVPSMDPFLIWLVATVTGYLVVRDGVTRGMMAAWRKQDQEKLKAAVKAEQAAQVAAAAKKASRGSGPAGA